jgi:hypothetical protein
MGQLFLRMHAHLPKVVIVVDVLHQAGMMKLWQKCVVW